MVSHNFLVCMFTEIKLLILTVTHAHECLLLPEDHTVPVTQKCFTGLNATRSAVGDSDVQPVDLNPHADESMRMSPSTA